MVFGVVCLAALTVLGICVEAFMVLGIVCVVRDMGHHGARHCLRVGLYARQGKSWRAAWDILVRRMGHHGARHGTSWCAT